MHHDVFITNKNFLTDLLGVFNESQDIGMVGMVGTPYLVKDGVMWHGIRFGFFYKLQDYLRKNMIQRFYTFETGYMEMEAVDGLLMATQYDIPWREDIFKKWDFYDVSQSFEFIKAGYKVVGPSQLPEWYIHDSIPKYENYYEERDKFLDNYAEHMSGRQEEAGEQYLKHTCERVEKGFHGTKEEKEHLLKMLNELAEE